MEPPCWNVLAEKGYFCNMTFKEAVYKAVGLIPKGRVATYGQVAVMAGYTVGASRAVGNAIHSNADPVKVPCHRVVGADGRMGSNFGRGGPAVQRQILEKEGVVFLNDKVDLARSGIVIEEHPMQPFLPANGRILFLGSFPPPRARWSMDFFYPNWINDFWRIQGLNGFGDPRHFEKRGEKRFDLDRITEFCISRGLAFFDTARKVCRLKGNASDEFLLILEPAPIISFLQSMPHCRTIVTTGGKASEEFLNIIRELTSSEKATVISINKLPAFGERVSLSISGRDMEWRRMPSTSRAYPMPLQEKAAYYSKLNV